MTTRNATSDPHEPEENHLLEASDETHGDGEAAHRIAFAALKHSFEKVGDHWDPRQSAGRATTRTPSRDEKRWQARPRPRE